MTAEPMAFEELPRLAQSDRYRKRIEYEDGLFLTRTNIFLVLNGLGAVAVGTAGAKEAELLMALILIFCNVWWILVSQISVRIIKALTKEHLELVTPKQGVPIDPVERRVRETISGTWPRVSWTTAVGLIIPGIVLLGWITGAALILLG